jgi:hypothetical protein
MKKAKSQVQISKQVLQHIQKHVFSNSETKVGSKQLPKSTETPIPGPLVLCKKYFGIYEKGYTNE